MFERVVGSLGASILPDDYIESEEDWGMSMNTDEVGEVGPVPEAGE